MSEITKQIEQLEEQKTQLVKIAERGDQAVKLNGNHEFRKLILDFFCTEECARYVHASADPAINESGRSDALAIAQASGHLKRFLSVVIQMANTADDTIRQIDEQIEELRAMGDAE